METVKQRIAELAKIGIFGQGTFVSVKHTSDDDKGEQFMSQLFFLCVELETNKIEEIPIVVKIQLPADERDGMGTHEQFANEVNFYSKVLSEFGNLGLELCPKIYYGLATAGKDSDKDLVVLEDIRASGFKLSKELFLDFDHIILTMKKLGEFHGLSFKLKKSSSNKMQDFARLLVSDPFYDYDNGLMNGAMFRGFKPLMSEHPDDDILKKAYAKMSTGSYTEQWQRHRKPEEPFAVIAHGDFNKNNLMYGYSTDGKVNGVKIFDFGTAMYSDPAIDITFFLYINTSADSREEHWDDCLKAYWEGVVSVEEDPGFSFDEFLKQFAKRAVWGYFPCCFYLPMLMFPDEMPDDFVKLPFDGKNELCTNWGGEECEKAVADIVRHLYKRGYLEEYVKNFDL